MHNIQQQLFRWTGFWSYIIRWLSLRLLQQQHTTSRIHSSTTWHIWSEQCLLCPTKQTWTAVQGLHWWVWPFSCYNWLCLCKLHREQLWVDAVHATHSVVQTHSLLQPQSLERKRCAYQIQFQKFPTVNGSSWLAGCIEVVSIWSNPLFSMGQWNVLALFTNNTETHFLSCKYKQIVLDCWSFTVHPYCTARIPGSQDSIFLSSARLHSALLHDI